MEVNFLNKKIIGDEGYKLCNSAYEFAKLSLAGKRRKSGEEIVDHCLKVAQILNQFQVNDPKSLAVAILHHTYKDSAATPVDIKEEFGIEIARMLKAFEDLRIIRLTPEMKDEFVENLRKMFLVLAKDLRIVLIKLADIMDNLTTLQYLDRAKGEESARETLEIFAPLVERLGMGEMTGQMQDLAFGYLKPEKYQWVEQLVANYAKKLDLYKLMLKIKAKLAQVLEKEQISYEIQNRLKHTYSLYAKLQRPENNQDITKVTDLIALRVIVNSQEDCYKVLGLVNKLFQPLPVPISDFIAHPKPNGYRSIHIKVLGSGNLPFEIQIRTRKMHEEAEYGVAAHWHYAEKKNQGVSDKQLEEGLTVEVNKLEWVKRLSRWQEEITDNQEFLKTLKTDFFGERIFCFTPKGDVKDLPKGATPIDFAYTIHTDLGSRVTSARVNGKVVGLDYHLKNADVVELQLSKDSHKKPNHDWLGFVVTSLAKRKIKKALNN